VPPGRRVADAPAVLVSNRIAILKRFAAAYVRPRWRMFALVQVLHAVAVGLLLVPPMIIKYVIDGPIPGGDVGGLLGMVALLVGVFAVFAGIEAFKTYWGHEIAQSITSRLRNDLYGHCQKLSMSFHDRTKSGGLLSRIVDDINVIQEVVHHGPEAVILGVVTIVGCTVLMLVIEWRVALVALAFMPVLIAFVVWTADRMWKQFREVRRRKESLSDVLEENLSGVQVIKAFGTEQRESEAVERENVRHYHSRMAVIRYMCRLFPGALLLNALAMSAALLYGGWLVIRGPEAGGMKIGALVALFMLLQRFLHPILRMVMMLEQVGRFFASTERFFEYMDIEPDIRDAPDAVALQSCRGEVTFDGVTFAYDDRPVLREVSFTARPGEMVALVGPSGAGKTTIVRLIPRFYEAQAGHVRLDGHDIRALTLRSLRSHIGTVMQDDFLFSGTVAENIAYGRASATRAQIEEAAELANAAPFIAEMPDGLDTPIGKRGVMLSEGQRQRISIARALLKDPQILLLDEATSSVDPETELLIQRAVERLRSGRTTFAIAHRLSTIFQADQILFVQDGRVIERGTHRELLDAGGEYARFFDIQFRKLEHV